MTQVFTGKLFLTGLRPRNGTRPLLQARVHIPADAADVAGFRFDTSLSLEAADGIVNIRANPESLTILGPEHKRASVHSLLIRDRQCGLPAVDFTGEVTLRAGNGLISFELPDGLPEEKHFEPIPKEEQPTYQEAVAGYYGAARALALDSYRRSETTSRPSAWSSSSGSSATPDTGSSGSARACGLSTAGPSTSAI